jgi:hypothetical protein
VTTQPALAMTILVFVISINQAKYAINVDAIDAQGMKVNKVH